MKIGDSIKVKDGHDGSGSIAATVVDIHADTGRIEFERADDGRRGVVWPDGIHAEESGSSAAAGKASVTHNGKPV